MAVKPLMILPPVVFAALAGLFAWGMVSREPGEMPSTMIGREAPRVPDEGLPGLPQLAAADLRAGEITIVNFWASWCPPCRAEHPTLIDLAEAGYRVAGINFRDDPGNAISYLAEDADPFFAQGFDPSGRVSIDWGVTAPPETFIVDGAGTVLFRYAGPLIGSDYQQRFLPALQAAVAVGG